jgi:hypothetical protein
VSNPCKQVCSHLCLLRPGGYSCACPQGSDFVTGSTVECDAGENTHCLGSLGPPGAGWCDLRRFNLGVARKGDEGTTKSCVRLWVQSCCYLCYKDVSKRRFSVRVFLLFFLPVTENFPFPRIHARCRTISWGGRSLHRAGRGLRTVLLFSHAHFRILNCQRTVCVLKAGYVTKKWGPE